MGILQNVWTKLQTLPQAHPLTQTAFLIILLFFCKLPITTLSLHLCTVATSGLILEEGLFEHKAESLWELLL